MYIRMMGAEAPEAGKSGRDSNANYIASRLKDAYPVLYTGRDGRGARMWP